MIDHITPNQYRSLSHLVAPIRTRRIDRTVELSIVPHNRQILTVSYAYINTQVNKNTLILNVFYCTKNRLFHRKSFYERPASVTMYIHSFVHYQMTTISNKETFIQVFVEKQLVLCETFHGNILTRGLSHKCLTL